jgi:hypothetical protein
MLSASLDGKVCPGRLVDGRISTCRGASTPRLARAPFSLSPPPSLATLTMTASHAAPLIPFTRLLTAPSPSASASCTPSAVPLAEIDDDETKALLGAHVYQTLATRPPPTLTRRQHDALVLCMGRKPLRLVVYSIPPDPSFTVRAILGDSNDANDQGMPVRDFLERVDATMVKMEDAEGRTSFMVGSSSKDAYMF